MILDSFAEKHKLNFTPDKGDYYSVGSSLSASHFYLIKPTTYMNLSGIAVAHLMETKKIEINNLLIIADDINLPTGKIRFRESGGDGGHNGLASVIYSLGTNKFNRLRFGVGNNFAKGEMPDYVLNNFYENEKEIVRLAISFSVVLIEKFITGGKKEMMNYYSKEANNLFNKFNNPN
jgi:PTH1 family peptidyl-tRNA hydrolase